MKGGSKRRSAYFFCFFFDVCNTVITQPNVFLLSLPLPLSRSSLSISSGRNGAPDRTPPLPAAAAARAGSSIQEDCPRGTPSSVEMARVVLALVQLFSPLHPRVPELGAGLRRDRAQRRRQEAGQAGERGRTKKERESVSIGQKDRENGQSIFFFRHWTLATTSRQPQKKNFSPSPSQPY